MKYSVWKERYGDKYKGICKYCKVKTSSKLFLRCRKCAKKEGARGSKHYAWKGDKVGYSALHCWVKRYLGKPTTCEHCGKSGLKGQQIHWANKSHEYKRDLSDWLRLCFICHSKYDGRLRSSCIIDSCKGINTQKGLCRRHHYRFVLNDTTPSQSWINELTKEDILVLKKHNIFIDLSETSSLP